MIKLTDEVISKIVSINNGFSSKQKELLTGNKSFLNCKGWLNSIKNKDFEDDIINQCIMLQNKHLKRLDL
jgi:hypothetical protein